MAIPIETLKPLPGPYDILEMKDRESREFVVKRWELGTMEISPKYPGAPERKLIRVLRIHVGTEAKPIGAPWWDVTSQTLIVQWLPYLRRADFMRKVYRITKHGEAPTARFSIEVKPLT